MWDTLRAIEFHNGNLGYRRFWNDELYQNRGRRDGTLTAVGGSAVNEACQCYYLGLDDPAMELLRFGERLLVEGIERGELERDLHPKSMLAFNDLAMCRWLLYGRDERQLLADMAKHTKLYYADWGRPEQRSLNIILPQLLNARDYGGVCEFFEQHPKNNVPKNLNSIRSASVMAYLLARHRLGAGEFADQHVQRALMKYLDRELDEYYLTHNRNAAAATWLKIAYWNDADAKPSPRDVLRKAYEHMPNVVKPF